MTVTWIRVQRTAPTEQQIIDNRRNSVTMKSPEFAAACKRAGIEITRRQASKFSRKRGLAYQHRIGG